MKIVLVRPNYESHIITPPLGLGYLSSWLRKHGLEVRVLDGLRDGLDNDALHGRILEEKPDAVGITCLTAFYHEVVDLTRSLKKEGVRVIVGGVHPTFLPQQTLEDSGCDFVIVGEGELAFLKLTQNGFDHTGIPGVYSKKDLEGGTTRPVKAERIENLDELPFPDWEQRSFASLYDFESTNSYSRAMLNYESGSVKNIHYGDIHTKFKTLFLIENEKVPFIDPSIDLSRVRESQYLQEGDLVIADASEDYADIGKSIEVICLGGIKTVAGLHTILARRKSIDEMFIGFVAYLMQSEGVRLSIMRVAQGTKVLGLSSKKFGAIQVGIPHLEEQRKIANCLSALDRKIGQVEAQVSQTRELKQGLLQKMFV